MTVQDLIVYLTGFSGNTPVILSKDAEGNGFSPLDVAETSYYVADTSYAGELDEYGRHGEFAIVLWPVN
jgi:hypothetical protein